MPLILIYPGYPGYPAQQIPLILNILAILAILLPNACERQKNLLPLNGARRFGTNIVDDAVDTLHLIDNP